MTVTPAYGRDYKSKAAALADWDAGKDFIISTTGQSVNKPNVARYSPGEEVRIRFNKLRSVVIVQSPSIVE